MSRLHICNTFFERELANKTQKSLAAWLRSHPIVTQLQFLPLLYAGPNDFILVSNLPSNPDPRLCLVDNPPKKCLIEHWGPSLAIENWAKEHSLSYELPKWETLRTINSKAFSFIHAPKLPGAELLETDKEIRIWIEKTPGPKVLKTLFGTAGSGHILNPEVAHVKPLYNPPVIGEPWVERIVDFSTQWDQGRLIGVTLFENEPNGTYKGTFAGEVESWALEEHLAVAKPLIRKIGEMGYSGNIGVDAFIYRWEGKPKLQPIVEINARKTMSWVALQTSAKQLYYTHSREGLLPDRLHKTLFSRNVSFLSKSSSAKQNASGS